MRGARALTAALILAVACGAAGCGQPGFGAPVQPAALPQVAPPQSQLRLGVYEYGDQSSYAAVTGFTASTGVRPNLVLQYTGWETGFDFTLAYDARAHHAEPLIQLQPSGISLAAITAGHYDRYLRTFANEVRRFGGPVVLGFAHEMNGTWYGWGRTHVPAPEWVAAWRHVVQVFRQQHASNATWLWTVSHTADVAILRSYWPGPSYVDWVGIDGYYRAPSASYGSVFGGAVDAVRQVTRKPILVAETAVADSVNRQPQDILQLFRGVKRQHLLGLVWFDRDQLGGSRDQPAGTAAANWRLEGDQPAVRAFNTAVRDYLW